MKERRADENFRKKEKEKLVQRSRINGETKQKAKNPEHIKEINKKSVRKRKQKIQST